MRVLVAEDDERTAEYLVKGLSESGHIVDRVADREAALAMASEGIYEALVLDRKLPGLDGLTVVRRLRQRDQRIPVLMLSGVATTVDRVEGLRAGCDDYLSKPYSFSELLARLEALLRRTDRARGDAVLRVGDLELDTVSRIVSRGGQAIDLQRRELRATRGKWCRARCCSKRRGTMIPNRAATSSTCIFTGCAIRSMWASPIG